MLYKCTLLVFALEYGRRVAWLVVDAVERVAAKSGHGGCGLSKMHGAPSVYIPDHQVITQVKGRTLLQLSRTDPKQIRNYSSCASPSRMYSSYNAL